MEQEKSIEDMSQKEKEKFARENHSEIERRRRNKMTAYITELSDMVPTCSALARKPDKLTILRMAVSHMKQLRGSTGVDNNYKPSFLTDQELKHLVLEAADGFLFVTSCETGQILYVSDTISPILSQSVSDWNGHILYDLVHADDIVKVREQLCLNESQNPCRVLDMKTGTVKKEGQQNSMRACMGSRRAFLCRMKCGKLHLTSNIQPRYLRGRNSQEDPEANENYAVMHITGFIRSWPPAGYGSDSEAMEDLNTNRGISNYALVAVARLQIPPQLPSHDLQQSDEDPEFISRHTIEGIFTFVDMRSINIVGYQPKELLNKPSYDFYHPEDVESVKSNFLQAANMKGQVLTTVFRFRNKSGEYVLLKTCCFAFQNPYNNEVEYVICSNSLVKPQVTEQAIDHINPATQDLKGNNMYNNTELQAVQQQFPIQQQAVKSSPADVHYPSHHHQSQYTNQPWNHHHHPPIVTAASHYQQPQNIDRYAAVNIGNNFDRFSIYLKLLIREETQCTTSATFIF